MEKKSRMARPQTVPVLPLTEREGFAEVIHAFTAESAALEASRCLDCDDLCSLCVTVCPNRANLAYAMEPFTLRSPALVVRGGRLVAEGARDFRVAQRSRPSTSATSATNAATATPSAPPPAPLTGTSPGSGWTPRASGSQGRRFPHAEPRGRHRPPGPPGGRGAPPRGAEGVAEDPHTTSPGPLPGPAWACWASRPWPPCPKGPRWISPPRRPSWSCSSPRPTSRIWCGDEGCENFFTPWNIFFTARSRVLNFI